MLLKDIEFIVTKRSQKFDRIGRDFYPTPYEAVVPLFPHLPNFGKTLMTFYEPCVGEGHLIRHLKDHALCLGHSDIHQYLPRHLQDPLKPPPELYDACTTKYDSNANYFITNPPWDRKLLHQIIENLSNQKLTWLLIDADWMHTKQAIPYLEQRCQKIVSVGRVKWFSKSNSTGFDNVCWYKFYREGRPNNGKIQFYPRCES